MKITKQRLKEIISEELQKMNEVDHSEVQVATAQHLASTARDQINNVNQSSDEDILDRVYDLAQDMNKFIMGLDDGSKKGALVAAIANVMEIVSQIEEEFEQ